LNKQVINFNQQPYETWHVLIFFETAIDIFKYNCNVTVE
jgi:hypothetical protein